MATTFITGSVDRTIKLWDFTTGKCLQVLSGHQGFILSIAFSPQENILASASQDETIKLWDFTTGECLKTMRSPKLYEKMNITGIKGLTEAQIMTLKALGAVGK